MKIPVFILLLLMPIVALAQSHQGMNEKDMQKMESCMQDIDQTKLKALEQRSSRSEAEVKSLCASGKREEAQAKAISFGKKIASDPIMQAMKKCSEMTKGMMSKAPIMDQHKDRSDHHVCD